MHDDRRWSIIWLHDDCANHGNRHLRECNAKRV